MSPDSQPQQPAQNGPTITVEGLALYDQMAGQLLRENCELRARVADRERRMVQLIQQMAPPDPSSDATAEPPPMRAKVAESKRGG